MFLIHHEVIGSTSDEVKRLLVEGTTALPLVVRADRQTAGRGRGQNTWWSDEGSLTFTLGIDPAAHGLREGHFPRMALVSALAIIAALESSGVPTGRIGIRWPNDLETAGRKLGGILPERVETPHGVRIAIGIGLNVATRLDQAPPDVRRMATTIEELRGSTIDRSALLNGVLAQIPPHLDALAGDDPTLARRWAERDQLLGSRVRIDLGTRIVSGWVRGIDANGGLILSDELGQTTTLHGGRVLRNEVAP